MSAADPMLEALLADLDGSIAVAVVEVGSGLMLASRQVVAYDLELAAAANTEVVKAKLRAIKQLGLQESIEDILITLTHQYHVIRPSGREGMRDVFTYLVLDRARANLALARRALAQLDETISL